MKNLNIGTEVTYKNCYGVGEIVAINGKTATLRILATNEMINKRLTSLKEFKPVFAYWGEQEIAAGQAKYNHGDVLYTCLSGDGNGCKMLWDDKNKRCVNSKEFVY